MSSLTGKPLHSAPGSVSERLQQMLPSLQSKACREPLAAIQLRRSPSTSQQALLVNSAALRKPAHPRVRCRSLPSDSAVLQHDPGPGDAPTSSANGSTQTAEDSRLIQLGQDMAEVGSNMRRIEGVRAPQLVRLPLQCDLFRMAQQRCLWKKEFGIGRSRAPRSSFIVWGGG